jgi:hypothetical protein
MTTPKTALVVRGVGSGGPQVSFAAPSGTSSSVRWNYRRVIGTAVSTPGRTCGPESNVETFQGKRRPVGIGRRTP